MARLGYLFVKLLAEKCFFEVRKMEISPPSSALEKSFWPLSRKVPSADPGSFISLIERGCRQ